MRRSALIVTLLLLGACAHQPGITSQEIDALTRAAMQEFQVPGAVVGVIKDGKVVHAAGYGVRELGLPDPVDTRTLFRIASMTKSMTTAGLATLVDAGKLGWDDKVVEYIPDFRMYYPWLTQEFTVTDLLTHRSGLKPYAGDLMLWPKPNSFTRQDIIHNLRYFKPAGDFRAHYDYDNLLYVVAGELFPVVAGRTWEEFIDERVLARIGAERCFAGRIPAEEMQNLAAPHAVVEGEMQVIERNRISAGSGVDAAAGGVRCSLEGMLKWMQVQLARGVLPDGSQLFSPEQQAIMWSPQTIRTVSQTERDRDRMHFKAYGLGWRLADVYGFERISHTGSFTGSNNWMVLFPELDLGVVVMLNASADEARSAIIKGIVRPYLGAPDVDWVGYYRHERELAASSASGTRPEPVITDYETGSVLAPLSAYAGVYRDPWFGDVSVAVIGDQLWFASARSPKLTGRLWPQHDHTFLVRWEDRSAERDIFVDFVRDDGPSFSRMEIRCLAQWVTCSFKDQDMNFTRVAAE